MPKKQIYEILDLEKFIDSIRVVVFDSFGQSTKHTPRVALEDLNKIELDELDNILSHKETSIILNEFIKKKIKKDKTTYYLNYNDYPSSLEKLTQRMFSNILLSLSNKGLIETAFDEEKNDFVFWLK